MIGGGADVREACVCGGPGGADPGAGSGVVALSAQEPPGGGVTIGGDTGVGASAGIGSPTQPSPSQ